MAEMRGNQRTVREQVAAANVWLRVAGKKKKQHQQAFLPHPTHTTAQRDPPSITCCGNGNQDFKILTLDLEQHLLPIVRPNYANHRWMPTIINPLGFQSCHHRSLFGGCIIFTRKRAILNDTFTNLHFDRELKALNGFRETFNKKPTRVSFVA